jgi:hypothetical protein
VTAVPCLYPLSGFIWSSSKLLKNRVNLNPATADGMHNNYIERSAAVGHAYEYKVQLITG